MYSNWKISKEILNRTFDLEKDLSKEEQKEASSLLKQLKQHTLEKDPPKVKITELENKIKDILAKAEENFEQKQELLRKKYSEVAEWCNDNQLYTITEDENYYKVELIPEPSQEELNKREIEWLKAYLSDTDYVVVKIAEGVATAEQYAEILEKRAEAREQINKLEGE